MKSKEHLKYLHKKKLENIFVYICQILILVIFLGIWELSSKYNLINSFIFSSPSKICITIKNLFLNYNLIDHILVTLYEVIIAFSLGIILSFIIAIFLYEFKILYKRQKWK